MTEQKKRVLSGMRPTGNLHIGNYFGAIKQFLELQAQGFECFFFVADLHALTEVQGPTNIAALSIEVAKNYLACGIDPEKSVVYRQSNVAAVSEIAVLLSNIVNIGRARTCTTFKDRIRNRGVEEGEVSLGLLNYPVLMAADILAVKGAIVPVGPDQRQHVEMARDFAQTFNRVFQKEVFTIPQLTEIATVRVPGINGAEKMGKSEGNTIALLEPLDVMRKKVMRIPTETQPSAIPRATEETVHLSDVERMYRVMQPGTEALYRLVQLASPAEVFQEFCDRYQRGEEKFFGVMKARLADDLRALLEPIQERYHTLDDEDVKQVLARGLAHAHAISSDMLFAAQNAMGL